MRQYRILQLVLAGSLALYGVAGFALGLSRRQEVYPVFSWSLFSTIPDHQTMYTLRILQHNGARVEGAPFFSEAHGIVRDPQSIAAQFAIRRLGSAAADGDSIAESDARHFLEEVYLSPGIVYEVVRIRFDPIEHWRTGAQVIEPIRQYTISGAAR